ncbi:PAP-specific phosphatase HAL2-like [Hibiscus syriacus]|uniref:PAP-specific phosphatase HAL2-like n=1 Tax=Hibiscus syriacus TaxID=106335 RepID=A0A6A2YP21_HIBSY|nr:PAP-specific phosphatase HAL2-like [Hibiscus syriacus]
MTEENDKYGKELDLAVRIVHMACSLCQKVQQSLVSAASRQVLAKDDDSPVTIAGCLSIVILVLPFCNFCPRKYIVEKENVENFVPILLNGFDSANLGNEVKIVIGWSVLISELISLVQKPDWSIQATVSCLHSEFLEGQSVSIVAEEDVQTLSKSDASRLLADVVNTVNECLAETPQYDLQGPKKALETSQILEAIALIEDGKLVLGVLGCPNYPMKKEFLNYNHQHHQTMPKAPPSSDIWQKGCVMYARRGSGRAWMQPLIHGDTKFDWPNSATLVQASPVDDPSLATFCEPVEKANSNHLFTAGLANIIGLKCVTFIFTPSSFLLVNKQTMRVHSMVKYAAIARGDIEVFMKFARFGYKEKIWDHAAGVFIVEEAGGVVTDAGGCPWTSVRESIEPTSMSGRVNSEKDADEQPVPLINDLRIVC